MKSTATVADAETYCLFCEKVGHRTNECWSTHGINTPRSRELFRLSRAAGAPAKTAKAAPFTEQQVADCMCGGLIVDTAHRALINGDSVKLTLPTLTRIVNFFAAPATAPDVAKDAAREFAEGVVYACARLIELFDAPTMAENILTESGIDVSLGCAEDIAFIRKIDRFAMGALPPTGATK